MRGDTSLSAAGVSGGRVTGAPAEWWRASPRPGLATPRGRLAFGALVGYTVVLVAAPQEFVGVLAPLRLALVLGLVAIAAHVADRLRGRTALTTWPIEARVVAALLAWAVITLPFSYWPGGSVALLGQLYLKSVVVCLLLACVVDSTERLRLICQVLVGCAVIIAIAALDHYRSGVSFAGAPGRIAGYGTSSMAGNPNDLALLLNIVIPINAALCLGRGLSGRWRLAGWIALALNVAGVVVTFSRAGFLTLALSCLLLLWTMLRRGAIALVSGVVVAVLMLALLTPRGYLDRLSTVSNIEADQTGSAQDRWRDIRAATKFVVQHPLIGAGLGMDYLALNELRGPTWLSVHNMYLNYAVDLGVIGLGLFLLLFALSFGGVSRVERARADRNDPLGTLATGVRIALCAVALAGFFHPIAYHAFFYYLAGLAIAVARIDRIERVPS